VLGLVSEGTREQSQQRGQSKSDIPQNITLHSAPGSSTSTQSRGATPAEKISLGLTCDRVCYSFVAARFSYRKSVPVAPQAVMWGTYTPIP